MLGTLKRKHQDWFNDNNQQLQHLLKEMNLKHKAWLSNKTSNLKEASHKHFRNLARAKLYALRDRWWSGKALELQATADRHNLKYFYAGLKGVFGPQVKESIPLRAADRMTLIHNKKELLNCCTFQCILNQISSISQDAIKSVEMFPTFSELSLIFQ